MGKFIPLSVPNLKGNEKKYVSKSIEDEWVSTGGASINAFENVTAEYMHATGAVACQNGTAGLHLSLLVNGIGNGDGVIVPALTFIAAINPVRYIGAEPFFMDCDDTLCMDMKKTREFCETECYIKNGELVHVKTGIVIKAMLVVHVFGNIADLEAANEICRDYNLVLIEDATEALGSYITEGSLKGRFAGTVGSMGALSYNGNKLITTGGGGMVVSNDEEKLKKAKYLSTQSKDDPLYAVHNEIGYNYRMTNLQAALGLAQMEQLEDFINIKTENYKRYNENGIKLLPFRNDIRPNYWFYSYVSEDRDGMMKFLAENQIQTRPIWTLICDLPPYRTFVKYKIERARFYQERVVNLPCSTNLTPEEVDIVCEAIKKYEGQDRGNK